MYMYNRLIYTRPLENWSWRTGCYRINAIL